MKKEKILKDWARVASRVPGVKEAYAMEEEKTISSNCTIEEGRRTEELVLELYSTPGLKRNEVTRYGKKMQLAELGVKEPELSQLLDELYPPQALPSPPR